MKSFFYIHSGVTYVCARLVIGHLKLRSEDCVLLASPRMKPADHALRVEPVPESADSTRFSRRRRFWTNWGPIRRLDRFINTLCNGDRFLLYVPHTRKIVCQLLASHPRCAGYSILEEGSDAYQPPFALDVHRRVIKKRTQLLCYLNYGRRASPYNYHYNPAYRTVYGLTEHSFPGYQRREILQIDTALFGTNGSNSEDFSDADILVLETSVEERFAALEAYCRGLADGLTSFYAGRRSNGRRCMVKFHPAQSQQVQQAVRQTLDRVLGEGRYTVLDSSVVLEVVLWNSRGICVITSMSSVGFYAHYWGHTVYSFVRRVIEYDAGYRNYLHYMFPLYARIVTYL